MLFKESVYAYHIQMLCMEYVLKHSISCLANKHAVVCPEILVKIGRFAVISVLTCFIIVLLTILAIMSKYPLYLAV